MASPGLDRAEVTLSRTAFEPHRHDSYALGITTGGVQSFRCRGARRVFVRDALAARPLPFVADPVHQPVGATRPIAAALTRLLADIDDPLGQLSVVETAVAVADGSLNWPSVPPPGVVTVDVRAVGQVRDYLAAHPSRPIGAAALERVAGTVAGSGGQ